MKNKAFLEEGFKIPISVNIIPCQDMGLNPGYRINNQTMLSEFNRVCKDCGNSYLISIFYGEWQFTPA